MLYRTRRPRPLFLRDLYNIAATLNVEVFFKKHAEKRSEVFNQENAAKKKQHVCKHTGAFFVLGIYQRNCFSFVLFTLFIYFSS